MVTCIYKFNPKSQVARIVKLELRFNFAVVYLKRLINIVTIKLWFELILMNGKHYKHTYNTL